jgi:hypothetical protein
MARITVRAGDFGRVLSARLRADSKLLKNAAYEAVTRGETEAVRLTDAAGLVDQGLYKRAWQSWPTSYGAVLQNTAPYAGVLEFGRRPGSMPPEAPIREWVVRKLVANGRVDPADVDNVTYLIRRKIYQSGTKPKLILRAVHKKLKRYLRDAALRELRRR